VGLDVYYTLLWVGLDVDWVWLGVYYTLLWVGFDVHWVWLDVTTLLWVWLDVDYNSEPDVDDISSSYLGCGWMWTIRTIRKH
jgi:hypothetical protein